MNRLEPISKPPARRFQVGDVVAYQRKDFHGLMPTLARVTGYYDGKEGPELRLRTIPDNIAIMAPESIPVAVPTYWADTWKPACRPDQLPRDSAEAVEQARDAELAICALVTVRALLGRERVGSTCCCPSCLRGTEAVQQTYACSRCGYRGRPVGLACECPEIACRGAQGGGRGRGCPHGLLICPSCGGEGGHALPLEPLLREIREAVRNPPDPVLHGERHLDLRGVARQVAALLADEPPDSLAGRLGVKLARALAGFGPGPLAPFGWDFDEEGPATAESLPGGRIASAGVGDAVAARAPRSDADA